MDEKASRLFQAIEDRYPGEATTAKVARRLNIGDNVVTNWKERGVSFKGAVMAEAAYGIPAAWVILGTQPPIKNTWPFLEWIDFERVQALTRDDLIFIAGKLDEAIKDRERAASVVPANEGKP